jgi:hypothetical protein
MVAGRTRGLSSSSKRWQPQKLAGRDSVLEVLADGATTLAVIDSSQFLSKVRCELETIDQWLEVRPQRDSAQAQ